MVSMLSPRNAEGHRPTLSNIGGFIPRPKAGGPSSFSRAMLSPRFLGNEQEKPKEKNTMRKALDARGGVVKERDGFEIFYGVESKQTRKRRTSIGDQSTSEQAAASASTAAPKQMASQPASKQGKSQVEQKASAPTATEKSDKRRPEGVPKLKLGSSAPKQTEAAKAGVQDKSQRSRRLTAPPSVAASENKNPMEAAFSSFASGIFSAVSDSVDAVVDAAIGPTPSAASTAPACPVPMFSPRLDAERAQRANGAYVPRPSPAPSDGVGKLRTPRGVPVFSLSSSAPKEAVIPEGVESYSLASPGHSPREMECGGQPNPQEATQVVGTKSEEAAESAVAIKPAVVQEAGYPSKHVEAAAAARAAIPRLNLKLSPAA